MRFTLLAAALVVAAGCTPQSNVVPKSSGSIAISPDDSKLFVVDADHDLLTVIDTQTHAVLGQTPVGRNPERVLVAPSGDVYVSNRGSRSVTRLSPDGLHVEVTATVGAEPVGLAMSANGGQVLVANSMSGTVQVLDGKTLESKAELAVGGQPFAVAPLGDNRRVYVTDFNGGTVRVVDLTTRNVVSTVTLEQPPSAECAMGTVPVPERTPAQTADVIVSPDGERAYVAHVQSRVGTAGMLNSLNFAVAPALSTIGTVDDKAMVEVTPGDAVAPARPTFPSPILATNLSQECVTVTRGTGMDAPSSLVVDGMGEWIFVADHNSNAVAVVSAVRRTDSTFRVPERGIADVVRVGARPTGIAVSGDLNHAYVHNALDYSVSFIEKRGGQLVEVATVGFGKSDLPADVERGRRLFYSAVDPRVTQPELGGVSCSSCHPNGRADGLSWVLPPTHTNSWTWQPLLASKRNTPPLWGVAKTAPYHWDGTISDLPAFNTAMVTQMGGAGVSTRDLSDLGAYMATIETPDNPNVGRAAPGLVARGSQLFQARCSSCHAGDALTDGLSHTVAASDVTTLDTPSLRGVFATGPYLHDGSAAALGDVMKSRGVFDHDQRGLSAADLEALEAFVQAQ